MARSVAEKLGVKMGMKTFFVNAPAPFYNEAGLPEIDLRKRLTGEFDYIHFFTIRQSDFRKRFENLKTHLNQSGILWVSWPKSGQMETDLNIKKVIEIGYDYGLVESKAISIDPVWSALKFTHPKPGKQYNNSFGKLRTI